jgi:DNA-binding transcriptional LysR family regulator
MTLGAYEVFAAIVERGSLAAAAHQLNLSPSAVSHALSTFEQTLGFALFIRSRTGVRLTAGGEALLPAVREVLRANEKLRQQASQLQGLDAGTVSIGTFSSVSVVWLPKIIQSFKERFPKIKVVIKQGSYEDVTNSILNSKVELGFVTSPTAPGLDIAHLYADPLLCVAPVGFEPQNRAFVTAQELATLDVVVQGDNVGKDLQQMLNSHKISVRSCAQAEDDAAIIAMVESGLGVSVMPQLALQHYESHVDTFPFFPAESRAIALACLSYESLSPAAKEMHEHIINYVMAWSKGEASTQR